MQDKGKTKYCYRCRGIGYAFMQCEKRNRSSRGKPNVQEKAYKVGCTLPVERLDVVKADKPEEEKVRR